MGDVARFSWVALKQFALGRLLYSPGRFGRMMVGDFLDTMAGYNTGETERTKILAELIRTSTTILHNVHQVEDSGLKTARELWPFPWDKTEANYEEVSQEEYDRRQKAQDDFLMNKSHTSGNSNYKS